MTRYSAHLQLHGAALLFGGSALLGKMMTVTPGLIVLGRGAFALLALSLICLCLRRPPWRGLSLADGLKLLALGVALALHWMVFFTAVQVGGVAMATLGFATFPAFTALGERLLFATRMTRKQGLILLLVSVGLILVTPGFDLRDGATTGLLWGIFSAATYAAIALANKRMNLNIDGLHSCWWQCLGISLFLLPSNVQALPGIEARDWALLFGLGVFCTGLAYSLFLSALKVVSTNTAAVVIAMEPVYAIVGAWLLFATLPTLGMLLGGALILAAVAWAGMRQNALAR